MTKKYHIVYAKGKPFEESKLKMMSEIERERNRKMTEARRDREDKEFKRTIDDWWEA